MVAIELFSVEKNLKAAQAYVNSALAGVPEVVGILATCSFIICQTKFGNVQSSKIQYH